ncbi:unnamed protein product, partial [Notodromas monacha]
MRNTGVHAELRHRLSSIREIFALGIKMLRFPLFAISLIALNSLLTPAFAGWSAKGGGGGGGGARCAGGGCARKLSATGGSGSGGSPYWWQDSKPFSNPDHGSGGSHQPSGNYPQQQQQQQFQNTCNPGYECVSYDRCDNGIVVPHGSAGQIDLRGKPNKNINALGSPCGNNQVCCKSDSQYSPSASNQQFSGNSQPQQGCGNGGCGSSNQQYQPAAPQSSGCGGGNGCNGQQQVLQQPFQQQQPQQQFGAPQPSRPAGGGGGALLISSKPYVKKPAQGSGCGPGNPGCSQQPSNPGFQPPSQGLPNYPSQTSPGCSNGACGGQQPQVYQPQQPQQQFNPGSSAPSGCAGGSCGGQKPQVYQPQQPQQQFNPGSSAPSGCAGGSCGGQQSQVYQPQQQFNPGSFAPSGCAGGSCGGQKPQVYQPQQSQQQFNPGSSAPSGCAGGSCGGQKPQVYQLNNLNSSSTQEVLHQVVVLVDHVEDSNLKCTNLNSNSTQEALHQVVALVDHVVASNLKYTQVHNLDHKSQYQVDALEGLVEVSDPKFNHLDHKLAHHLQVVALVDHVVANNLKCTNLNNHSKFPSQEDVVDLAILVEDKDNKHINLSLNPVPALVDSNLSQQDQGVAVLEPLDVGNRDLRFNQQDFQTIISMPVQPPNIARQPFPSAGGNQNSINANFKPYTGPTAAPVPFAGCSAGLLCVENNLCNATGYKIPFPDPIDAQNTYRVAVMDCTNPDTGIIGVCCRDPDYVDPWPGGMMMTGPGMKGKRDVAAVLKKDDDEAALADRVAPNNDEPQEDHQGRVNLRRCFLFVHLLVVKVVGRSVRNIAKETPETNQKVTHPTIQVSEIKEEKKEFQAATHQQEGSGQPLIKPSGPQVKPGLFTEEDFPPLGQPQKKPAVLPTKSQEEVSGAIKPETKPAVLPTKNPDANFDEKKPETKPAVLPTKNRDETAAEENKPETKPAVLPSKGQDVAPAVSPSPSSSQPSPQKQPLGPQTKPALFEIKPEPSKDKFTAGDKSPVSDEPAIGILLEPVSSSEVDSKNQKPSAPEADGVNTKPHIPEEEKNKHHDKEPVIVFKSPSGNNETEIKIQSQELKKPFIKPFPAAGDHEKEHNSQSSVNQPEVNQKLPLAQHIPEVHDASKNSKNPTVEPIPQNKQEIPIVHDDSKEIDQEQSGTRFDIVPIKPIPSPGNVVIDPIAPLGVCGEGYECVPHYQCDESGFIVTDGDGILDLRQKPLPSVLPE